MNTVATKQDAIEEIGNTIEANGRDVARREEFDTEAIAEAVRLATGSYDIDDIGEDFWLIVQKFDRSQFTQATIFFDADFLEHDSITGECWIAGVVRDGSTNEDGDVKEIDCVPLPGAEDFAEWELLADEALASCGWLRTSPFAKDRLGSGSARVVRAGDTGLHVGCAFIFDGETVDLGDDDRLHSGNIAAHLAKLRLVQKSVWNVKSERVFPHGIIPIVADPELTESEDDDYEDEESV